MKKSARGRLAVIDGKVIDNATPEQEAASELVLVWKDNQFYKHYSLEEIRANAKEPV
jgi:hypothetical protein